MSKEKLVKELRSEMDKMAYRYYPSVEPDDFPMMTRDAWDSKIAAMSEGELRRLVEKAKNITSTYAYPYLDEDGDPKK